MRLMTRRSFYQRNHVYVPMYVEVDNNVSVKFPIHIFGGVPLFILFTKYFNCDVEQLLFMYNVHWMNSHCPLIYDDPKAILTPI